MDEGSREYGAVDSHYLLAEAVVAGRELSAEGERILVDHLKFFADNSENQIYFQSSVHGNLRSAYPTHFKAVYQPYIQSRPDCTDLLTFQNNSPYNPFSSVNRSVISSDKMILYSVSSDKELRIGDRLLLRGKCCLPEGPSNPGQFDLREYYRARDIYFSMQGAELLSMQSLKEREMSFMRRASCIYLNLLADIRKRMRSALTRVFGEEDAAMVSAVILGDRSGLSSAQKRLFQEGGLAHILAISSMHISLLGRTLYKLLRRHGRSFLSSVLVSSFFILSYCIMTGNSFSARRAAIVFFIWLGSQLSGRTEDRLTSLSLAALIILIRQPRALWDSSFLISFSCVLSIELLAPVLHTLFEARTQSGRNILTSLAVQAGTMPVISCLFYQITPFSFLFNLLVLPCMSIYLAFALGAAAAGFISSCGPAAAFADLSGQALAGPCHYLRLFFEKICMLQQDIPGSVLICGHPPVWKILLYYAILLGGVILVRSRSARQLKEDRFLFRPAALILFIGLTALLTFHRKPAFRFSCLDIGQGSCNLIEDGDFTCLFDAGSSSIEEIWNRRIEPVLKYYGISELDCVFLSHGDTDHINGIEQLLSQYHRNFLGHNCGSVTVKQIILPDCPQDSENVLKLSAVIRLAREQGIELKTASEGVKLSYGDMKIELLGPSADRLQNEANQDCLVALLSLRKLKILLPGDLEKEGEKLFVEHYLEDSRFKREEDSLFILVAGHHGSRYASTTELLRLTDPDYVLISCGENNRYGHPSEEMLERLREEKIPWLRTDRDGAITIREDSVTGDNVSGDNV